MGSVSTTLTVTIVTNVPDPGSEDLLLEAEIVAEDNNGETTYYVGQSYTLRLFKSTNINAVQVGFNVGNVSKSGSGFTAAVPYTGEDPEYVIFSGGNSASLNKVLSSGFQYTPVGNIYDKNGAVVGGITIASTPGSKNLIASQEIYGVFNVSYVTKYDTYRFSSPQAGPMLIFFIGTN